MSESIYLLCALTSMLSAWLLLRSYRRTRYSLLLWSGLCFSLLAISNLGLVLDKIAFPDIDFSNLRSIVTLAALLLLLFGLIWNDE